MKTSGNGEDTMIIRTRKSIWAPLLTALVGAAFVASSSMCAMAVSAATRADEEREYPVVTIAEHVWKCAASTPAQTARAEEPSVSYEGGSGLTTSLFLVAG